MKQIVALALCCMLTAASHGPLTWVAIGDSITYLNDHKNETGDRLTKGYLTDVTDKLPYVHYVNQGHNGWTTTGFAQHFDELGIPAGDVYTIFLGTNDWWQGHHIGHWPDYEQGTGDSTIYGCFRIIINKLHGLNPNAPIILMTPMPRADFVYINDGKNNAFGSYKDRNGQSLEQVAAAIADIGQREGFRVIDLYHERRFAIPHLVRFKRLRDTATGAYRDYSYPDYISIPFHPDTDVYPYPVEAQDMTYDGLHPSDKGDALIAKKVMNALKKL
jgi:lysophospholipase L1-like esterase